MSRAPTWISESVKKNKIEKEKICIYAPIALVIHLDEMSIANLIVCLEACQRHAEQESEKLRENKRGEREEGIGKVRIKTKKLNEWGLYSFRCAWNSCRRSGGHRSASPSLRIYTFQRETNKQINKQKIQPLCEWITRTDAPHKKKSRQSRVVCPPSCSQEDEVDMWWWDAQKQRPA